MNNGPESDTIGHVLTSKTTHPGSEATNDTAPRHIWLSSVVEIAGVSMDDANKYATRERLSRAYQAGEPAWMAADMVRQFVRGGQLADRADHEIGAMRRAVRSAILSSRNPASTQQVKRDLERAGLLPVPPARKSRR